MRRIVIFAFVPALLMGLTATFVTGQFCETAECAPNESTDHSYDYSYYGWPVAWRTDTPPHIIELTFHEGAWSYGTDDDWFPGVGPARFLANAGLFSAMAVGVELVLFASWHVWRKTVRRTPAP